MPNPVLQTVIRDILEKNVVVKPVKKVLIYDTQSGLARMMAEAYSEALGTDAVVYDFDQLEIEHVDLKNTLIGLPAGSLVILVQSTNFRLTDFRIRLELFQHGIHCIEHNHLGYLPPAHYRTYIDALKYRTPDYVRCTDLLNEVSSDGKGVAVVDRSGARLEFGPLEMFRGNTGDYTKEAVKGGTYPIGEAFSEAIDLESVNGSAFVYGYPDTKFQVVLCDPFEIEIVKGRLVHNDEHPADFLVLMDMIREQENGEVLVRELGIGFNPEISPERPISDVNSFERQLGVHLSLGKKHGIFGKKLPKTDLQKYHIDVFLDSKALDFSGRILRFSAEKILTEVR